LDPERDLAANFFGVRDLDLDLLFFGIVVVVVFGGVFSSTGVTNITLEIISQPCQKNPQSSSSNWGRPFQILLATLSELLVLWFGQLVVERWPVHHEDLLAFLLVSVTSVAQPAGRAFPTPAPKLSTKRISHHVEEGYLEGNLALGASPHKHD